MPNILPLEWTVVAAAFVVFCAVPALMAWVDARRLRRAAAATAEAAAVQLAAAIELPPAPVMTSAPSIPETAVPTVLRAAAEISVPPEVASAPPLAQTPVETPPVPDRAPAAVEPLPEPAAAPVGYTFCLQELRRVRLDGWPPASVRDDAEQRQRWEDGQRAMEAEQERIDTVALRAPFPPQAYCYAGAEFGADRVRVCFLLFPGLWPSTAAEATATALVTVGGGEVAGTVEAVGQEPVGLSR